ncbi:S-adenosyl-L-methionine-dependent methyltransferase [Coprinopsis marcescibilis]|uniref:S-adenosyl-L-methionine-dependent methyltransferase n=1 Tax=Coprinopsis marcescibilis TaxID=230819 RepID=A0A5C3KL73_COPMA|nr:S-adenosyl-L-methionine-dependent methyltransferase [Coprinopsis marcescibilis]
MSSLSSVHAEKDVQDQLLNARKCRRKPGEVPYPFEHNNGMVDFDIWEHMFFVNCFHRLTMHPFERPPKVVLDLGCGGGYWALEAAKQWTSSTIIGYDITDVQPKLHDLPHHRHLADRVKWVHGNLLDGLPFLESQFDFVRIAYLGLGVPEDEWQFVLEEISRVMKPGAILEVLEEDLIFPCTTVPSEPPRSPTMHLDLSLFDFSSPTSSLELPSSISDRRQPPSPLKSKLQDLGRSKTASKLQLSHTLPFIGANASFTSQSSLSGSTACIDPGAPVKKHPQDHSRIRASWDSMLSKRFLCPQLLSVLPFYLSSFFDDIKTHPPYKVPLPPNSNSIPPLRSRHSAESFRPSSRGNLDAPFDLRLSNVSHSHKTDGVSIRAMYSVKELPAPSRWSSMHLARTVNTVAACKGPISKEYEALYTADFNVTYRNSDITLRQVFERDWNSWLSDMNDRMCMRDRLGMGLAWPETPGDRPDCRKWRSDFEPQKNQASEKGPAPILHHEPNRICRSMRAFTAKKSSS